MESMMDKILQEHSRPDKVLVIAIDGRCAAGKTTMAELFADNMGAGVIHMDDFFLPGELRTKARLQEPGGNVHYERFLKEVLPNLRSAEAFSYRRFDCGRMDFFGDRGVKASSLRIVEGAYSHHPALGDYADIRIFLDVNREEQLRRIEQRNGREALNAFLTRWIPFEEQYFAAFSIKERADFIYA